MASYIGTLWGKNKGINDDLKGLGPLLSRLTPFVFGWRQEEAPGVTVPFVARCLSLKADQ